MVEKLGEMRKGRRERIDREGIEKETKRQFEEKEGLRDPPPPLIRISRSDPAMQPLFLQVLRVQASKFGFYKLIECIIKKVSWCETECKKMCHW